MKKVPIEKREFHSNEEYLLYIILL